MKKNVCYFMFFLVATSCSTIKHVKDNEQLLTENKIYVDSLKVRTSRFNDFLLQKPNAKVLGFPLTLHFYNMGNPNGPKNVSQWKKNHPKTYNFVKSVFSEKQSVGFANSFLNLNSWILNKGQAPVTIDAPKTKKTVDNLKIYYQTKGYFKTKIHSEKKYISDKKGLVKYYINRGEPLVLDSIYTDIKSPTLDSIYQIGKSKTFLKKNETYKNQSFINEANRLTKLFRNNGVYHFTENSIGFYNIDTTQLKTNVEVKILDRVVEKKGVYIKKPYTAQKVKKVNVFTDYSYAVRNEQPKFIQHSNQINFLSFGKMKYNPNYLSQSVFIKPNHIYQDTTTVLTRMHLRGLKNFKYIAIKYKELTEDDLEANIYLTPIEKFSLGFKTELSRSNVRDYDISGKFSIGNRNVLRGTESLKFSVLGSYFNSKKGPGWEFGADLSLEVPRFVAPFGVSRLVPKRMLPKTKFFTGISIQKNIGLDRQNISVGINYNWNFNHKKSIQLDLLNAQYIKNLNVNNYFSIFQSELGKLVDITNIYSKEHKIPEVSSSSEVINLVRAIKNNAEFRQTNPQQYRQNSNILNRYNIVTSSFLIPEIAYTFTYNNQENFADKSFSYFQIRISNSGNVAGYINNKKNSKGKSTVLKIPIAQYMKTDIEYKKYWDMSYNSVFAFRAFLGAIFAYNNSDIPFSRSYFAGGSNDVRAWRTYELGLGSKKPELEYNTGSLKILTNLEYRFDLIGSFKGALFLDSGNIWDINKTELDYAGAKFNGFKSLADIAIGSGIGFRYDFKFLVARMDIGFKVHEPYLKGRKWLVNHNFGKAVYNIGINYPF